MLHSSSKKIIKSKEKNPEIKSLLNSHSQLYNIRTNFPIAIKHCEPLEINQTRYKNCDLNPCELLWANDANEIVSNGRLIEYSDGTTQIVIGKHIFEVKKHLLSKKIFFCADFFLDKSEKNNQSDYMDSKTDLKSSGDLSLTEVLCDIGQMMVLQNKKVKPNFKAAKEVEKPKTRKIEAHELKTTEELFEDVEQLRRVIIFR